MNIRDWPTPRVIWAGIGHEGTQNAKKTRHRQSSKRDTNDNGGDRRTERTASGNSVVGVGVDRSRDGHSVWTCRERVAEYRGFDTQEAVLGRQGTVSCPQFRRNALTVPDTKEVCVQVRKRGPAEEVLESVRVDDREGGTLWTCKRRGSGGVHGSGGGRRFG